MWRLILIYSYREHDYAPREYGQYVFDSMGELTAYLNGVSAENVFRVIIERL